MDYAALIRPSANRVYTERSPGLVMAELAVLGAVSDIATETIAGLDYVVFSGAPPGELDLTALARTSSLYALFTREGELLRPVAADPREHFDDDLVTIQRYVGKTNERFTQLLTNVTLASSLTEPRSGRRLTVLDPLCGRGTTLNRALTYGCHAAGVEVDRRDFDAYVQFLREYCKRKRIKHRFDTRPTGGGRHARRMRVTLAPTKAAVEAGDTLSLDVVNAGTAETAGVFRPES